MAGCISGSPRQTRWGQKRGDRNGTGAVSVDGGDRNGTGAVSVDGVQVWLYSDLHAPHLGDDVEATGSKVNCPPAWPFVGETRRTEAMKTALVLMTPLSSLPDISREFMEGV
jgi:hypothetical protein